MMSGSITVIYGSMCFAGFHVSRPSDLAVGSPCLRAAYPCAYSWAITENNRTGAKNRMFRSVSNGGGREVGCAAAGANGAKASRTLLRSQSAERHKSLPRLDI